MIKLIKFSKRFLIYILIFFVFCTQSLYAKTRLIYSSEHVIEAEEFKIDNIETLYNSANGFRPTLYFDFLNDTQLILSKGNGEIFIFNKIKKDFKKQTTNLSQIFLDQLKISKNYKQRFGGPGIRDIKVDIENNNLYVTLISTDENHCLRLELLNASAKDLFFNKVWETPCVEMSNAHSTGGTIDIDKKHIYLTVGDFWHENNNNAQNLKSYFGKIIKFDKNKILKKEKKIKPKIFSIGHRNPQGLQILKNNRLIASEHGPAGGDEINLIKKNKNYGWPIVSSGQPYNLKDPEKYKNNSKETFEEPLFTFLKSVGVSSVVVYDNKKFSRWKQNFLVATLKNRSIFRLNFTKTGSDNYKINGIECIKIGQRIRKLRVYNGSIYLTTDEGNLLSLNPFINNDYGQKYSGPKYAEIFGSFIGPMNFCN